MTTSLCNFIPDTSRVFKYLHRKVCNNGFQRDYYFAQNRPYEETEYKKKLLPKAEIMNDNIYRSTNFSNKILLVFISELIFSVYMDILLNYLFL